MKKIGKKISFLTKIMLVIGLFFSELMPLKYVFAYEKTDDLVISLNENTLNIIYNEVLEDETVNVKVDENYVYLDDTQKNKVSEYNGESVSDLTSTGLNYESILSEIKFDGEYTVNVTISRETDLETDEIIATNSYTYSKRFETGLSSKVFDTTDTEVIPVSEVYKVDNNYTIKTQILSGGLAPTWLYTYNNVEVTGQTLIEYVFEDTIDYGEDHLYGDHIFEKNISFTKTMSEEDEELFEYSNELYLMYGEYSLNTDKLNDYVSRYEYNGKYKFEGTTNEGKLYVLPDGENKVTGKVSDIFDILDITYESIDNITYLIKNGDEESLRDTSTEDDIVNGMKVVISCGDLNVIYTVVKFADINNDGVIDDNDISSLIDKNIGLEEQNTNTDDVNKDGNVDLEDLITLYEKLYGDKEDATGEYAGELDAKLDIKSENIVSGDTFDIDYVLTLSDYQTNGISGKVVYDKSLLELIEIKNKTTWKGNNNDGKFIYIGESLDLAEVEEEETAELTEEEVEEIEEESTSTIEYVVLTLTFKAKKAGEALVNIEDNKYIDGVNYINCDSDLSETVVITGSSDNSLKSLTIGGKEVTLEDGTNEYKLTVDNSVSSSDIDAILNDENAKVKSVVKPESLLVGENTITIEVEAENGEVETYTIIVTRKEEEKKTTTKVTYTTNSDDDDEVVEEKKSESESTVPIEKDDTDDTEEEDDGKLSRIIIIILILLVIAGLIYLIFKDDDDNKDLNNKLKELDKDDKKPTKEVNSNNSTKKDKPDIKKESKK